MPDAKASRANRSRRDKRAKFIWLDQVKADDKLPRSAFIVAFELMQGFNAEYGGASWKSIKTLAEETGLSEPSIVRITRQLAQHGHLKIEPGKAGRGGHTNRYFLVKKTSADGGLQTSAQTSAGESQTSASGVDSLKTHLRDAKASPVREGKRSRSLAVAPGALAPVGGAPEGFKQEEGFAELWALWSSARLLNTDQHEAEAWRAYTIVCPDKATHDEIMARARQYLAAKADDRQHIYQLANWLSRDNWLKPPMQRKQTRGRRDEPTTGEVLLSKYGDRS